MKEDEIDINSERDFKGGEDSRVHKEVQNLKAYASLRIKIS